MPRVSSGLNVQAIFFSFKLSKVLSNLSMPAMRAWKAPARWKRRATASKRTSSKYRPSMRKVIGSTSRLLTTPGSSVQFARLLSSSEVFPTEITRSFTYCDAFSLASQTVTNAFGTERVWRLNSLFDPDLTGVGHQPYYYDQVSFLYMFYRVFEAAWEVTFTTPGTINCFAAVLAAASNDTYSLTGKASQFVREKPNTVSRIIGDGSQPLTVIGNYKIHELEGITYSNWIGDKDFQAATFTNPVRVPTLKIAIGDFSAPITETIVGVHLRLVVKARLFARSTQLAS